MRHAWREKINLGRLLLILAFGLLGIWVIGRQMPWITGPSSVAALTYVDWQPMDVGTVTPDNYSFQATGLGPSVLGISTYHGLYQVSWSVPLDCALQARILSVDDSSFGLIPAAAFGYDKGAGKASFSVDDYRYYVQIAAPCRWQITLAPKH